jgi:hypothetical protein
VRRYVIETDGRGNCNVLDEYGRETKQLTLGEMLEQMVSLCHRGLGEPQFGMMTPEAWDARWEASAERGRLNESPRDLFLRAIVAGVARWIPSPDDPTIGNMAIKEGGGRTELRLNVRVDDRGRPEIDGHVAAYLRSTLGES